MDGFFNACGRPAWGDGSAGAFVRKATVMTYSSTNMKLSVSITDRELEVLTLLSDGLTVKEIASELFISHHTVVSHKKSLYEKLDVGNCFQLGMIAERLGLLQETELV